MSKHTSTQLGMSSSTTGAHNIQPEEQTQISEIIHYTSTLLTPSPEEAVKEAQLIS